MQFKKNEYLAWMMQISSRPMKYQLADSGMSPPTAAELGLKAEQLSFVSAERTEFPARAAALLSRRHGIPAERILLGVSCSGSNFFSAAGLIGPGDDVLVERPIYEPLRIIVEACGGIVRYVDRRPENDFDLLPEDLERAITPRTRLVFLTNMHNPTGRRISPEHLRALGEIAARNGAYVIVDEIYLEYLRCPEGDRLPGDFAPAAALHDNLITTSSFSKVYGLYGPRIGWILANPNVIERADTVIRGAIGQIPTTSINILISALEKEPYLRARNVRQLGDRMLLIKQWCESRGDCRFIPPAGAGICFVKLPDGIDSMRFCLRLLDEYSTMIVPSDFYLVPGYLRVSSIPPAETITGGLANASDLLDKMKKGR